MNIVRSVIHTAVENLREMVDAIRQIVVINMSSKIMLENTTGKGDQPMSTIIEDPGQLEITM